MANEFVTRSLDFSHDFDQLMYQAMDLEHIRPESETPPSRPIFRPKQSFRRFTKGLQENSARFNRSMPDKK
ncbi:hypothetical protein HNP81_000676 [Peribacillus huizhouensis]|uniref:Uncharacterized protein n=1 Tax=Peribacillus huizhouensis TaxID=1501239 RepID=A0ABR6CK00_9BACI|nr:hypothetical protein [Peribacillus huizhouensis]